MMNKSPDWTCATCDPDVEHPDVDYCPNCERFAGLRADVRRTELALQACAMDTGAAGLWDGDTASMERAELEARTEYEAACAELDHELWWRAVLADPRERGAV